MGHRAATGPGIRLAFEIRQFEDERGAAALIVFVPKIPSHRARPLFRERQTQPGRYFACGRLSAEASETLEKTAAILLENARAAIADDKSNAGVMPSRRKRYRAPNGRVLQRV